MAVDLDNAPTVRALKTLAIAGVLDATQLSDAIERTRPTGAEWRSFGVRAVLVVGVTLLFSGVIYFFASSWSSIPGAVKIGLGLALVVGAAGAAAVLGMETWPGKVAAAAAGVFVGPALLVYGSVYQTGADAWELFFGWCLLIVPFALLARQTGLWILWLVLVRAALYLFVTQNGSVPAWGNGGEVNFATVVVACIDVASLIVAEVFAHARRSAARSIVALMILSLGPSTAAAILGRVHADSLAGVVLPMSIVVHLGLLLGHRALRRDAVVVALGTLSSALHIALWVGVELFSRLGKADLLLLIFLYGVFLIVEMGAVAAFLRMQTRVLGGTP
jgi:uncharacterized membrane protein